MADREEHPFTPNPEDQQFCHECGLLRVDHGDDTTQDWIHASPYGHLHLRDLFAAFALAGMIARGPEVNLRTVEQIGVGFAGASYLFADFMMAQRRAAKQEAQ